MLLPEDPLPDPELMPEPLLEPELEPGVLVVLLPLPDAPEEPVPLVLLLPPVAPPEAAEPDLLKYASHSCLETWPSLFLSTDVKLGLLDEDAPDAPLELPPAEAPLDEGLALLLPLALGVELAPEDAPPEDEDDGLELLLPLALGVELAPEDAPELPLPEDLLLSLAPALELDPDAPLAPEVELCAIATLDNAKSAAAVAVPTTFNNI